jgi:hypothetical protein
MSTLERVTTYSNCILDYARLERVTQGEKPYRGTTNRYPLEERRYATKCFKEETLNGEKVYRVYRDHNYEEKFITLEEYNAMSKAKRKRVHPDAQDRPDELRRYKMYERTPCEVGIVYPDNSFEFTAKFNWGIPQGLKMAMSYNWLNSASLCASSKHGGALLSGGGVIGNNYRFTHPVFNGLRVYVNTLELHESCSYEVSGYKTNNKAVKAVFEPYKESFTVADVMFRNMRDEDIIEMVKEVTPETLTSYSYHNYLIENEEEYEIALNNHVEELTVNPLLSTLGIASLGNVNKIREHVRWAINYSRPTLTGLNRATLVANTAKAFKHKLCREDRTNLLEKVAYESSKKFPASIWGNEVRVTGILVEQYK